MDKKAVLAALKSYAEEHLILDHKENYELKDHRWHARDMLVKGMDGRNDMVDGLFDRSEAGTTSPINLPLAAHLPHLPHLGLRLDTSGEGPNHGYRLEVEDPDKLQAALFHSATDDERFNSASVQVGHLLGTLEGMNVAARKRDQGGYIVPAGVYEEVGQAAMKGNPNPYNGPQNHTNHLVGESFQDRLQNIKTGMGLGLTYQDVIDPQALRQTHTPEELREKVRALDEDDWRWHNRYVYAAPTDPSDFEDFFDEITNVDPKHLKTEDDVDNAYEVLLAAGANESVAADWADERKQNLNSGPTSVSEVDDWLDNEHGHAADSVDETIQGAHYLDSAGTDPDVISDWISGKLNVNTSDGGAVSDHSYDDRPFDPVQAVGTVKAYLHDAVSEEHELLAGEHETAYHEAVRHVAQWPDADEYRKFRISQETDQLHPDVVAQLLPTTIPESVEEKYMVPDAEHRARAVGPKTLPEPEIDPGLPVAELVKTPEGQRAFFRALDDSDMMGFDGDGNGWDRDTTHNLFKAKIDWDRLPPEDRARRYADAARYIDRSAENPLMVFSDDASKAMTWLQDGAYKYSRYTTVPSGDGHTRTEREDVMGIGRVNYAAHGFDAALPPIINADGVPHYSNPVFPQEDVHDGECADFRTMGYGNTRFMFDYPSTPVSHAVSDTYMDARFCPDGGWRALLANAPAFAETQGNYKNLANPTQGSSTLELSGHEIPTFVELHPKDLPASGLRSVQLRGFESPNTMLNSHNDGLIRGVLAYSGATVTVTPNAPHFYPPDYEHRRIYPKPSLTGGSTDPKDLLIYNNDLLTGSYHHDSWSEQQARELIAQTQEHIQKEYGDRVRLYVPKWARR